MAQQSALPHKEKVAGANPARPHFSKRGRAAIAARCKRAALRGYEGASPSASTILHPTRRKRRTVLVRQTAGRTSLWMLQFFCGCGETVYAPERESGERKLVRVRLPLSATLLSRRGEIRKHGGLKTAGRDCLCRCTRPPRPICGRAWNRDRTVLKNRCIAPLGAWACGSAPAAPIFRRVAERRRPSLRNSRAPAHAGANPVSLTNFSASSSSAQEICSQAEMRV